MENSFHIPEPPTHHLSVTNIQCVSSGCAMKRTVPCSAFTQLFEVDRSSGNDLGLFVTAMHPGNLIRLWSEATIDFWKGIVSEGQGSFAACMHEAVKLA